MPVCTVPVVPMLVSTMAVRQCGSLLNPKPAVAGCANLRLALTLALLLLALLALLALLVSFIFIHVKYLLWENLHRVILRWVELHLCNLRLSITLCTPVHVAHGAEDPFLPHSLPVR